MPLGSEALRDVLRQTELSGAVRRAAVLHTNRLPAVLGKPHHVRLAREALRSLMEADRAQVFELSRGRIAVIWRNRGGDELAVAQMALDHLLSDQPGGHLPALGHLLTIYDLPGQAPWLMDELAEPAEFEQPPSHAAQKLDLGVLARLETSLAQADLSRFVRRRSVVRLPRATGRPFSTSPSASPEAGVAWDMRSFAVQDLAAALYPDLDIRSDAWLFRRLTRLLDTRMLALLAASDEASQAGCLGLNFNVASMLADEFLRFDALLPKGMRGQIVLYVNPADILGDPAAFLLARNFANLRGYRLVLAGGAACLMQVFDFAAAGCDGLHLRLSPELLALQGRLADRAPPGLELIVSGLDRHADIRWAIENGVALGSGRAFNR